MNASFRIFVLIAAMALVSSGRPMKRAGQPEISPSERLAPKASMARELVLPAFQATAIQDDFPASDIRVDEAGRLWVAGKRALWRWDGRGGTLQRIDLGPNGDDAVGPLRHLGTDQSSLLLSDDRQVWRIQLEPLKVLRFLLPAGMNGASLGFSGSGDEVHWIHSSGVLWIDRYGRKLQARMPLAEARPGDRGEYFPGSRAYVYARESQVLRRLAAESPLATPTVLWDARQPILDFTFAGEGFVGITARFAFFLDKEGRFLRSSPVEGRRRVVGFRVTPAEHVFCFHDGLCEIYDLKTRQLRSWQLGDRPPQGCEVVATGGGILGCLTQGSARLFLLDASAKGAMAKGAAFEVPASMNPSVIEDGASRGKAGGSKK